MDRPKMSLETENVIPGEHGMTFTTNIENEEEFNHIKNQLTQNSTITNVQFDKNVYPTR